MRPASLLSSVVLLGVFALGAGACVDEGEGQDPNCMGAKCDDPGGPLTSYAKAVVDCDEALAFQLAEAGANVPLAIDAFADYSVCLLSPANSAIPAIEDGLIELGAPLRSLEEISVVFDEYRYASLCIDIEAASSLDGEALSLQFANCVANRERTLAEVIGAFVRFGEEEPAWELSEEREPFAACYGAYDEALLEDPSPSAEISVGEALVSCAENVLRGQALPLMEARCEKESCIDALLTLAFVQAGIETSISTSERLCQLLIDSSAYQTREAPGLRVDCRMTAFSALATQVAEGLL